MAVKKLALASISPDNFLQTKSNLKGKEQFTVQSEKRMSQDSGWPRFYFERDHRPLHDITITIKGSCIISNVFSNQNMLQLWLLEFTLVLDVNFQRSWMVLNSSKRGTFNQSSLSYILRLDLIHILGFMSPRLLGQLCLSSAVVFISCHYICLFLGQEKQDSQPLILAFSPYNVCSALLTEGPWVSLVPQHPLAFPIRSSPKTLKFPFFQKTYL